MRFEQQTEVVDVEAGLPPLSPEQVRYEQALLVRYCKACGLEIGDADTPGRDDAVLRELVTDHGQALRLLLQTKFEDDPALKEQCDVFMADRTIATPPQWLLELLPIRRYQRAA